MKTESNQNNTINRTIRKDSSAEVFTGGVKTRNLKSIESQTSNMPSRNNHERKAYVPMIHR